MLVEQLAKRYQQPGAGVSAPARRLQAYGEVIDASRRGDEQSSVDPDWHVGGVSTQHEVGAGFLVTGQLRGELDRTLRARLRMGFDIREQVAKPSVVCGYVSQGHCLGLERHGLESLPNGGSSPSIAMPAGYCVNLTSHRHGRFTAIARRPAGTERRVSGQTEASVGRRTLRG